MAGAEFSVDRHAPRVFVSPIALKYAQRLTQQFHRRLPKCQGGMWAVAALIDGAIVGVAIVGHPQARLACLPGALEVLRVAVCDGAQNACSALYGACARASRDMGASDLITYIHGDETGHSLKAAGWVCLGEAGGGAWNREGRQRSLPIDAARKIKWAVPWGRLARTAKSRVATPSTVLPWREGQ